MHVIQTMELKDVEKPKPPFEHSCCVTGSSSGNGRSLLPSTCVWQLLSALPWDGPSSGSAEQDLFLSFISHAAPGLFHQVRVSRQSVVCENSAFLYRRIFSGQEWEESCPQGCLVTWQWHSLWQAWDAAVGAELTPTLSSVSSSPVLGGNMVFQSPFSPHCSCASSCWFLLCCGLVCGSAGSVCKYIT